MGTKSNDRIQRAYEDLIESMGMLVQSREAAFLIVWFDIYDWMEPKDWRSDICGVLAEKVTGQNIGSGVHSHANTLCYQKITDGFAFGTSIDELGEYWKDLIREEKSFRLRLLLGCLKVYYEQIMPYVKNEMVAWFKEAGRNFPELAPTLKPYREHRARIKSTMQIVETALDIFTLQHRGENDSEEI